MEYSIGDKIVYPMHGAGEIQDIEEKEILGEIRSYYIMDVPNEDMEIMIPVDNMEDIGIRDVISRDEIDKVMDVLKAPSSEMSGNWNHRNRENMEKLKTGDIFEVAEVVRNLVRIEREKHLSTGEKKMLANAKQILSSEIILVTGSSEEEAEQMIDEAI